MPQFNPLASFAGGKSSALGIRAQEQGLAREAAAAPVRNQLAQLDVQKSQLGLDRAKTGIEREGQQFDQSQALRRIKLLNQGARAIGATDPAQWQQAIPQVVKFLGDQGIDAQELSQGVTPESLGSFISQTDELLRDPTAISKLMTSSQRERAELLRDIQPALDDDGTFDPKKADSKALSAARALNLISKPGTKTKEERIAGDQDLAKRVGSSQAKIKSAVKQAEVEAKARGETATDLTKAKAALPGIKEVVGKLKVLADGATFTLAGRGFNEIAKQFGFSTKGDTARSSMVAIVDNQVLPLLKPIFGAAFTKTEGDSLKKSLLDPDSTPDSRKAQLDAFLTQMERNIETKERESNQQSPGEDFTSSSGIQFTVE